MDSTSYAGHVHAQLNMSKDGQCVDHMAGRHKNTLDRTNEHRDDEDGNEREGEHKAWEGRAALADERRQCCNGDAKDASIKVQLLPRRAQAGDSKLNDSASGCCAAGPDIDMHTVTVTHRLCDEHLVDFVDDTVGLGL